MFTIAIEDMGMRERLMNSHAVLERETTNWLVDMAMWMKSDLKKRVPVKKGVLRNSIRYETKHTSNGGEVAFLSAFYGPYLDEGTRPFTITASNGKPMTFYGGSDQVFAHTVKNPGIKARDFTIQCLEAAEPEADRHADRIAENILGWMMP